MTRFYGFESLYPKKLIEITTHGDREHIFLDPETGITYNANGIPTMPSSGPPSPKREPVPTFWDAVITFLREAW